MSTERKDKQETKIVKLAKVRTAAIALREAQISYMANRGNQVLGEAVGKAAEALDKAIKESY